MMYKRVAKCVNIIRDERGQAKIISLKYNNGHTESIGANVVRDKVRQGELKVINLSDVGYKENLEINTHVEVLYRYAALMEGAPESEKSHRMALKATVLDCGVPNNMVGKHKNHTNELIVTDEDNVIKTNIRAKNAIFVGNKPLVAGNNGFYVAPIIRCNRAIIMNPCVMSGMVPNSGRNCVSDRKCVRVMAKTYEISHEFVDVNTVYEILSLLDYAHTSDTDFAVYTTDYRREIIVDFNKANVDYYDIKNITQKILYERLDASDDKKCASRLLVSALHFTLCMYMSTEYKIDYLLELGEMCILELSHGLDKLNNANREWFTELHSLYAKLMNGYRA